MEKIPVLQYRYLFHFVLFFFIALRLSLFTIQVSFPFCSLLFYCSETFSIHKSVDNKLLYETAKREANKAYE